MSSGETFGNNRVCCRIERHSDVSARDFHIFFWISGHAIAPIDNAILARINRGLEHGVRDLAAERSQKTARAASGITTGKHIATMFLKDLETDGIRSVEHCSIGHCASKGRAERDYRSYLFRTLPCDRTGDHSPEAVPNQMNFASGLGQGFFDRLIEAALDQQVRTFRVNANTRKIRMITNTPEPRVKLGQVKIGTEKTGNNHDGRSVPARHAQAVIHGRGMQQENLGSEKSFRPEVRAVDFRVRF